MFEISRLLYVVFGSTGLLHYFFFSHLFALLYIDTTSHKWEYNFIISTNSLFITLSSVSAVNEVANI